MFIFFSNVKEIKKSNYDSVVFVCKNIRNKEDLFDLFAIQFKFPSYFGKNWDALYDCLSDLKWLKEKKFLILHEDLPFSDAKKERENYVNLLSDLEGSLDNIGGIKIDVAFLYKYKDEIELIVNKFNKF